MVDALNRCLWNKYSKTERSWSTMRIRWKPKLPRQPGRTTTITTKQRRTQSDQLDWDPEIFVPWWTKTGPLWYPYHGKDLWTRTKRVRSQLGRKDTGKFGKICAIQSQDVVITNPSQEVQESCAQNYVRKETTETRPKHPHTIPRQSERSQHRACHWSRAEKTHSLLPLPTTWTYGERVSESSTEGHCPIFSQEFLFARRCFCTVA